MVAYDRAAIEGRRRAREGATRREAVRRAAIVDTWPSKVSSFYYTLPPCSTERIAMQK